MSKSKKKKKKKHNIFLLRFDFENKGLQTLATMSDYNNNNNNNNNKKPGRRADELGPEGSDDLEKRVNDEPSEQDEDSSKSFELDDDMVLKAKHKKHLASSIQPNGQPLKSSLKKNSSPHESAPHKSLKLDNQQHRKRVKSIKYSQMSSPSDIEQQQQQAPLPIKPIEPPKPSEQARLLSNANAQQSSGYVSGLLLTFEHLNKCFVYL